MSYPIICLEELRKTTETNAASNIMTLQKVILVCVDCIAPRDSKVLFRDQETVQARNAINALARDYMANDEVLISIPNALAQYTAHCTVLDMLMFAVFVS
jgi:hypothetical protein